jgi:hypothetical protein
MMCFSSSESHLKHENKREREIDIFLGENK